MLWSTASCPLLQLVSAELLLSTSVAAKIVLSPAFGTPLSFWSGQQKPERPRGLLRGTRGAVSDAGSFQQLGTTVAVSNFSDRNAADLCASLFYHFTTFAAGQTPLPRDSWADSSITARSVQAGSLLLPLPFCQSVPSAAAREVTCSCSSCFPRGESRRLR